MRDAFLGESVWVSAVGTEARVRFLSVVVITCFFVSNSVDVITHPIIFK
jgi:hypothetical protein